MNIIIKSMISKIKSYNFDHHSLILVQISAIPLFLIVLAYFVRILSRRSISLMPLLHFHNILFISLLIGLKYNFITKILLEKDIHNNFIKNGSLCIKELKVIKFNGDKEKNRRISQWPNHIGSQAII